MPILGVRGGRFYFDTVRVGWRQSLSRCFEADLFAAVRFDGYDSDDSADLEGMRERRSSLDAGVRLGWLGESALAALRASADALDRSGGNEVALEVSFPVQAGGWSLAPGFEAARQSSALVDYYYGVRREEATAERPFHAADASLDLLLRFDARRALAEGRWTLLAFLRARRLGDGVRDSPLVDRDVTLAAFVGLTRRLGDASRRAR